MAFQTRWLGGAMRIFRESAFGTPLAAFGKYLAPLDGSSLALNGRRPRARRVEGRVAVLNLRCSHNHFHWLLEALPRYATLLRARLAADYYLIDCHTPLQRHALEALGIAEHQLIQPHSGLVIEAAEL